jgi:preprotein translocase subunit SecY
MFSAFVNCFKIPELRDRIIVTLGLLIIARVGANIPLPGLDPRPLQAFFAAQSASGGGNLLGLYNMFTGGALLKGALFALGIMPYISASIIFQLMGSVVPSLARLQQEGEVGRQKLTQYTRYATVGICVVQAIMLVLTLENPARLFGTDFDIARYGSIIVTNHTWFLVTSTIFLTAGTIMLMWIGERITERGIGNGTSILITIGILADIPGAVSMAYRLVTAPVGSGDAQIDLVEGLLMAVLFVLVIVGLVMLTQAVRKIPVQYAKRQVGRKVYGGQSSFLPLKANYAGVMPIIFASAILMFLQTMLHWGGAGFGLRFLVEAGDNFMMGRFWYYVVYTILIVAFSYLWVSIMFKPIQIADDLKKYGGYIPGVRPGEPTAKFLDFIMTRLTAFGIIALIVIALFPDLLMQQRNIPYQIAQFFGGTGMLITVGVLLDVLRQVETYLLDRHYDGFLRRGRIKGRSVSRARSMVDTQGLRQAYAVVYLSGALVVSGLIAFGIDAWMLR